ncbi:MAG: hypothetical protein WBA46_03400 [Thermomicrobiales bacterium]
MTPIALDAADLIPAEALEPALVASSLSPGGQALARGLIRLGHSASFGGGGIGIEYGALLKAAARPEYLRAHVREAAVHLRERRVDLLLVPGLSGHPIGAMYAIVSGIPAVLLKKEYVSPGMAAGDHPHGAFLIPSYTGEGDVRISADTPALQDIVDTVLRAQLDAQRGAAHLSFSLRMAGADDIIDKATMSQAVSERALTMGAATMRDFLARHRQDTGDDRPATETIEVVAWVTPLMKGYNRPQDHLQRLFGITPFAGLTVSSVHLDPQAIGIEGLGIVRFP